MDTIRISLLGSTGSIGTQTLDVVDNNPQLSVCALAAGHNIEALAGQIIKYEPKLVCIAEEKDKDRLLSLTKGMKYELVFGMDGLIACAEYNDCDIVVTAIVGMLGIRPTIAAINAGHDIALANKETLVCAGHIIMPLAKEKNVRILPVDSEHSAIFQCLNGEDNTKIEKILLTASGGPFRGKTREEMKHYTKKDALKHPNWVMGQKITIDSATMVNKGLEVMEAKWLFGVDIENVQVVVQPKSIIHSMVQFVDGSIIAQLGTPDMRLPIQYALFYPNRRPMKTERLDLFEIGRIEMEAPDYENFRGLFLAREAGIKGGNMPTILNAANEYAVARFLKDEISFLGITDMIEKAMNEIPFIENPTLEDILKTEELTINLLKGI